MKKPHVKNITFAVALLSVTALASCSYRLNNEPQQTADGSVVTAPSRNTSAIPVGYRKPAAAPAQKVSAVQPAPVAAPVQDAVAAAPSPPPSPAPAVAPPQPVDVLAVPPVETQTQNDSTLVWHKISHYDAADPSLPPDHSSAAAVAPAPPSPPVVQYNESVDVYPVGGDLAPYRIVSKISDEYIGNSSYESARYENARVEQVYFPYGSAHVAGMDRQNLKQLAHSLVHKTSSYRLTVIGHASRAVSGVKDPLRKKIINFRMAEKRADAVARVLIKSGAAPDWVEAKSVGDTQPAKALHGMSQQTADQRADVFLDAN